MKSLDQVKLEAQEQAKIAAESESEFKDLERREAVVLAQIIASEREHSPGITYQWAKNIALSSENYELHLDDMKAAQERYLAAHKDFRVLIDYIGAITSENYRLNAEYKAGK